MLGLSTEEETCDFRNNIVYALGGGDSLALIDDSGTVDVENNWFSTGYRFVNVEGGASCVNNKGRNIEGIEPGFVDPSAQDFRIVESSPCMGRSGALNPGVLPDNDVTDEYVPHRKKQTRYCIPVQDLGAFEFDGCLAVKPRFWMGY